MDSSLKVVLSSSVSGDVLNSGPREAANFPEKRVRSANGCLCSTKEGVTYDHNSPLFLLGTGLNAALVASSWLI